MLKWSRQKDAPEEAPRAAAKPRPQAAAHPPRHDPPEPAEPAHAPSLPELLVQQGKATREQIAAALKQQEETGQFLGEILIELKVLDEQSLITFLAKHCKIPHLSLLDYLIDEEILGLVPEEICLKHRLIPIDRLGRNLTVAMVNPLNQEALAEVQKLCPDLRIKPILCAYRHFELVTQKLFGKAKKGKELTATAFGLKRSPAAKAAEQARSEQPRAEAPPEPELPAREAPAPEPEPEPAPQPTLEPEPAPALEAEDAPDTTLPPPDLPPPPELPDLPPPPPPPPPPPAPVLAGGVDSDAVIDGVFGGKTAPAPSGDTPEVMQAMANVMMDSMRDTYTILARRMAFFRGVGPEDIAKLFSRGITREFEEGQVIFEKGDPGDALYVILGGAVSIHDGGRELGRLEQGGMFGEMALATGEPRSASATAVESTSLLRLSWELINHVMPPEVSAKLLVNMVITLSERLRRANEQ